MIKILTLAVLFWAQAACFAQAGDATAKTSCNKSVLAIKRATSYPQARTSPAKIALINNLSVQVVEAKSIGDLDLVFQQVEKDLSLFTNNESIVLIKNILPKLKAYLKMLSLDDPSASISLHQKLNKFRERLDNFADRRFVDAFDLADVPTALPLPIMIRFYEVSSKHMAAKNLSKFNVSWFGSITEKYLAEHPSHALLNQLGLGVQKLFPKWEKKSIALYASQLGMQKSYVDPQNKISVESFLLQWIEIAENQKFQGIADSSQSVSIYSYPVVSRGKYDRAAELVNPNIATDKLIKELGLAVERLWVHNSFPGVFGAVYEIEQPRNPFKMGCILVSAGMEGKNAYQAFDDFGQIIRNTGSYEFSNFPYPMVMGHEVLEGLVQLVQNTAIYKEAYSYLRSQLGY